MVFCVVLAMDFSWWLSAWVSSKVVGMGFGGWNGGGMVLGTMIMVVVASQYVLKIRYIPFCFPSQSFATLQVHFFC